MIYTWLTLSERSQYLQVRDKDVNEALQEARAIFGPIIYVEEHYIVKRSWFKKIAYPTFRIYILANTRTGECQMLNFYTEERIIFTKVSKQLVLTYLYGLITGKQFINF